MNPALILVLFFLNSIVSASSSEDQQLEVLNLPSENVAESFGPRESRHRSLTQSKAPDTLQLSPHIPHISHKSPTSIIAAVSADFTDSPPQKSNQPQRQQRLVHNFKSFASLPVISFRTIKISKITSPRKSPIIAQLNVLDHLMASAQFPLAEEPRELMTGHLSVLRAHCRHLAASLGPLNTKATNCAFRYHELVRFVNLLSKYGTTYETTPIKRNFAFCSALVSNLRRLQTLANQAIYDHFDSQAKLSKSQAKYQAKSLEITSDPRITALLKPHEKEVKDLDKAVDTVDLDLLFYCGADPSNHESIYSARDLISKFLHLAFL